MTCVFVDEDFTLDVVEDSSVCYDDPETIAEPNIQDFLHSEDHRPDELEEDPFRGYTCQICSFSTKHKLIYFNHIESHQHSNSPLICKYCNETFKSRKTFQEHRFGCSKNKLPVYQCTHCSFKTLKSQSFRKHASACSNKTRKCKKCGFVTKLASEMMLHRREKHPFVRSFSCTDCDFKTGVKAQLTAHCQEVHPRPYKCKFCEVVSQGKKECFTHRRLHSKFLCSQCVYSTSNKGHFQRHLALCNKSKLGK
ncbi:oocyte zinc finger protein XlCOF28 [Tribolium castaneum]|uniref:Zinc finger Y-chromosomal protein-like Protein n=1 Tax=Tribolium castaneum TaxID=7070 RepID=D2A5C6_TRICA|nr:PREDICTED: oocyte zinc finger protein XlCOF28 [Tribolium castaneum]EFA05349.1 Zinc finger Y-chromosomal protein-like Protein [Tribolium castaneum]|eukprot:XP_015836345.1 PREDICTED: oocyte zinc finger protein XlCOF28 [Tribolium castaneum]